MAEKDGVVFEFEVKGNFNATIKKSNILLSKFNDEARKSVVILDNINRMTKKVTGNLNNFAKKQKKLNDRLKSSKKSLKKLSDQQKIYNKLTGKGAVATQKMSKKVGKSTDAMKQLKTVAALTSVVLAVKLGKAAFSVAAEFEVLETKFQPLLGSVTAAKERIQELTQFAASTPFQLKGISQASIVLESLTEGALSTGDGLRLVGDAAAQAGVPIQDLAVHVGRAFSALKANRPAGEAIARMQELGLVSGSARNQIEQLTKASKGQEAFSLLRKELEKTSGGMEKLSQTFSGKLSTISDNFALLGNNLVKTSGAFDLAKDAADSLLIILDDINTTVENFDTAGFVEALNPLSNLFGGSTAGEKFDKEFSDFDSTMKKLTKTFEKYDLALGEVEDRTFDLDEATGTFEKGLAGLELSNAKGRVSALSFEMVKLSQSINSAGNATQKAGLKKLLSAGAGQKGVEIFENLNPDIAITRNKKAQAAQDKLDSAAAAKRQLAADKRIEAAKKEAERLIKVREDFINKTQDSARDEAIARKDKAAEIAAIADQEVLTDTERLTRKFEAEKAILELHKLDTQNLEKVFSNEKISIAEQEAEKLKQISDKELAEEKKRHDERMALNNARFNAASMLVGGLGALTKSLQKDREKDSVSFKAFALTEAGINTARAITQTLADRTLPSLVKIPTAIGIGAFGAAAALDIVKAENGLDLGLIQGRNTLLGNVLTNDGGRGQEARVSGGILSAPATNRFGPGQIAAQNNNNASTTTVTQSINFSPNITVASEGQAASVIDDIRAHSSEFADLVKDVKLQVD